MKNVVEIQHKETVKVPADFNNLTQEPLGENWTITIHAKGSDYSLEQGGFFHDRYYLNMTVDYRNQTK